MTQSKQQLIFQPNLFALFPRKGIDEQFTGYKKGGSNYFLSIPSHTMDGMI